MGNPGSETIGGVNTAYSVCAIISGWFLAAPCADLLGRKSAMAIGSLLIIIGAVLETCTRKHTIGMFIAGRAIVGLGQGIALCKLRSLSSRHASLVTNDFRLEETIAAGPSYIGEITPHRIRGIVMTFWQYVFTQHKTARGWQGRTDNTFQFTESATVLVSFLHSGSTTHAQNTWTGSPRTGTGESSASSSF